MVSEGEERVANGGGYLQGAVSGLSVLRWDCRLIQRDTGARCSRYLVVGDGVAEEQEWERWKIEIASYRVRRIPKIWEIIQEWVHIFMAFHFAI